MESAAGRFPGIDRPAAQRLHLELKAELQRDLFGVFRQNRERARAYVAQSDDANIDLLHIGLLCGMPQETHNRRAISSDI